MALPFSDQSHSLSDTMKIIIVGAGIAGLSLAIALGQSGHQVTILDAAPQLAELGAGVQMTPQALRYLIRWGLKEHLLAESIIPKHLHVWDGSSGNLLGHVRIKQMETRYGAPYIVVHRAVLHNILHRHAIKAGGELLLDSDVVDYDFANGAVQLRNGKRLTADLVVAADGAYESIIRKWVAFSIPTDVLCIHLRNQLSRPSQAFGE